MSAAGMLETFVPPAPAPLMIAAMTAVNRTVMLKGFPLLREITPLNGHFGFRGLASVRHIDLPEADEALLKAMTGPGKAVFFAPNHPEFFTDWMLDKEILSRVAPQAASWATHSVVNGMGRMAQKFWLANNLVAQIPGSSKAAQDHSISWALKGHGVLLHPEGAVNWHSDHVAPLMPGAAEMALACRAQAGIEAFVAPIVWKLVFLGDMRARLAKECAYVEASLRLPVRKGASVPERVHAVYDALTAREEERIGGALPESAGLASRRAALSAHLEQRLLAAAGGDAEGIGALRAGRRAERALRKSDPDKSAAIRKDADAFASLSRLGPFAFRAPLMTQEHMAEHLKRLRTDHCKGSWRDTANRFVPQAVGPRRAYVRVPEALSMQGFSATAVAAMAEIRARMQASLDGLNAEIAAGPGFVSEANPFYMA